MFWSKPVILFFTGNILLVMCHVTVRTMLITRMRTIQELEYKKSDLSAQKNNLILTYEQLKDPLTLTQQAQQNLHMEKVRLSRIKHLKAPDALATA